MVFIVGEQISQGTYACKRWFKVRIYIFVSGPQNLQFIIKEGVLQPRHCVYVTFNLPSTSIVGNKQCSDLIWIAKPDQ